MTIFISRPVFNWNTSVLLWSAGCQVKLDQMVQRVQEQARVCDSSYVLWSRAGGAMMFIQPLFANRVAEMMVMQKGAW